MLERPRSEFRLSSSYKVPLILVSWFKGTVGLLVVASATARSLLRIEESTISTCVHSIACHAARPRDTTGLRRCSGCVPSHRPGPHALLHEQLPKSCFGTGALRLLLPTGSHDVSSLQQTGKFSRLCLWLKHALGSTPVLSRRRAHPDSHSCGQEFELRTCIRARSDL